MTLRTGTGESLSPGKTHDSAGLVRRHRMDPVSWLAVSGATRERGHDRDGGNGGGRAGNEQPVPDQLISLREGLFPARVGRVR
jgi:hypothetical protein